MILVVFDMVLYMSERSKSKSSGGWDSNGMHNNVVRVCQVRECSSGLTDTCSDEGRVNLDRVGRRITNL